MHFICFGFAVAAVAILAANHQEGAGKSTSGHWGPPAGSHARMQGGQHQNVILIAELRQRSIEYQRNFLGGEDIDFLANRVGFLVDLLLCEYFVVPRDTLLFFPCVLGS